MQHGNDLKHTQQRTSSEGNKRIQCTANIKELDLLQYFWRGLYICKVLQFITVVL